MCLEKLEQLTEKFDRLNSNAVNKEEFHVLKGDIILKYAIKEEVMDLTEIVALKATREDMMDTQKSLRNTNSYLEMFQSNLSSLETRYEEFKSFSTSQINVINGSVEQNEKGITKNE